MTRFLVLVGLVVVSFAVVASIKTGQGIIQGTDTPADLGRNINQEYIDAGLIQPAHGSGGTGSSRQDNEPVQDDFDRRLQEMMK